MIKYKKSLLFIILAALLATGVVAAESPIPPAKKLFLEKEATRFKMKMGVFLVLIENDQVLLLRRYNTGIGDGKYVFPMGGVELGETASQAIIREAKEEANVTVRAEDLEPAHVMHQLYHLPDGDTFEQVNVFFVVKAYEGVPQNMEPHKADELKFYPLQALPSNTEPFIRDALLAILEQKAYSENGFEKA